MLFINANLYTMDKSGHIEKGYLLTEGNKITGVGSMENCPAIISDCIDLGGKLLLPGFIDTHSHLGMIEDSVGVEGDDINEMSDPCTPQLRAIDGINPFDRGFAEALAGGVTAVMTGPGSANPIGGQTALIKTWGKSADKMVIPEVLGMKFAMGENPKAVYGEKHLSPTTRMGEAAIIREQLYKTKRYLTDIEAAQKDSELDPPEYDIKCEAMLPLLKREAKAHFHAHRASDISTAMRISAEFGLDYLLVHCTEGHLIADLLAEAGAKVINGPILGFRCKPELRNFEAGDSTRKLIDAGLTVAICTDHPEVTSEYLAFSAAVATKGLDFELTLATITCNAAAILGTDRIGSLAPGKDADFSVFNGSPFEIHARPEMVWIDGERRV